MKKIKLITDGLSYGISYGLIISLFFNIVNQSSSYLPSSPEWVDKFSTSTLATLFSVLIWASIGVLFTISSEFFFDEKYGLTKATVLHFMVTYPMFSILAKLAGWFPMNIKFWIFFTLEFVFIYFIIWIIIYKINKSRISKINKAIKK